MYKLQTNPPPYLLFVSVHHNTSQPCIPISRYIRDDPVTFSTLTHPPGDPSLPNLSHPHSYHPNSFYLYISFLAWLLKVSDNVLVVNSQIQMQSLQINGFVLFPNI